MADSTLSKLSEYLMLAVTIGDWEIVCIVAERLKMLEAPDEAAAKVETKRNLEDKLSGWD